MSAEHAISRKKDSAIFQDESIHPKPGERNGASIVPSRESQVSPLQEGTIAVGKSAFIEGRIDQCETCLVAGVVEGYIATRYFQIDTNGRVHGEANVEEAVIAGEFSGKLTVSSRLHLKSGAKVMGEISYSEIAVEAGALLAGRIVADDMTYNQSRSGIKGILERIRR